MRYILLMIVITSILMVGCVTTEADRTVPISEQNQKDHAGESETTPIKKWDNKIYITDSEIIVTDHDTGKKETAFYWNYNIDNDSNELRVIFQENEDYAILGSRTFVFCYVVPWTRGDETGYFVRNSTYRRQKNSNDDNLVLTFTHDFKDTTVTGFHFTRLMIKPGYEFKDESIITNPWSSYWTFTDQSLVYSDDEYHTILGKSTE